MPKVVLIGGPADGIRKTVDQMYPFLKVTVSPKSVMDFSKSSGCERTYHMYEYELMELYGVAFYMFRSMNKELLIQKLLSGYYPNE